MSVLVVDDSLDNQMLFEDILDEYVDIVFADSALEAYDFLNIGKDNPSNPDTPEQEIEVILMDVMMPGISGIEATRTISTDERYCDIPIIIVTARTDDETLQNAFEAGAIDFLTKPVKEIELIARLKSARLIYQQTKARKERENDLKALLDEIQRDLNAAGILQKSLMPDIDRNYAGIEANYYFSTCSSVGGDLLNVFSINESSTAFFLLDVSGHGARAALIAFSVYQLLSSNIDNNNIVKDSQGVVRDPSEVASIIHNEFKSKFENYGFCTMIYGVYNNENNLVRFVRCGHQPPLKLLENGDLHRYEKGDIALWFPMQSNFQTLTTTLQKNEVMVLFSDGITEASKNGKYYENERFESSLKKHCKSSLKALKRGIVDDLHQWLDSEPIRDDVSLLLLKRT